MLKKAPLHPALPRRAETRPFPSFVLGSSKSSTYPWDRAGLGRLAGRVTMGTPAVLTLLRLVEKPF
jgi:hypothetical protein